MWWAVAIVVVILLVVGAFLLMNYLNVDLGAVTSTLSAELPSSSSISGGGLA